MSVLVYLGISVCISVCLNLWPVSAKTWAGPQQWLQRCGTSVALAPAQQKPLIVFKYFTRALRDQFLAVSEWGIMLAKIVVSDLQWGAFRNTITEMRSQNYVRNLIAKAPWENGRFINTGVKDYNLGVTYHEEVAE